MSTSTPKILKESYNGISAYNIEDEMLTQREIGCVGEITTESVNSIITQILYLSRQDDQKEITIYINSPGGEVSSGLALYDIMQAVKCPIHTVCIGIAASMGAILFAAGDKRDILPHARVMIHDPLISGGVGGNALRIKSLSEDLMMPQYDYVYLGDNARAPYGTRSFELVYEFTLQAVKHLFAQGCPLVILGCNTASAKALRTIQQRDLLESQWILQDLQS